MSAPPDAAPACDTRGVCDRCGDARLCRIFGGCMAASERQREEDEKARRAVRRDSRMARRRRQSAKRRPRGW
ncbi:MAG: hypothetical protein ACRC67_33270 [Inquilinus sp.]|uniref:hypothetical protein n=1 Tax=Inquilinus sp. TaxID=1932117 RepID=UPI003F39941D